MHTILDLKSSKCFLVTWVQSLMGWPLDTLYAVKSLRFFSIPLLPIDRGTSRPSY